MKKLACLLPLLFCLGAANVSPLQEWPFRKVGDKYLNLKPYFGWWKAKNFSAPNPMPEWDFIYGKVTQITDDGILVAKGSTGVKAVMVINHPEKSKFVDGDLFASHVTRAGNYEYVSVTGAKNTVEKYDHGICYDPNQKGPDGKAKLLQ